MFGLDADKVEIWDFFHRNKYGSLEDKLDLTLEESRILEGQDILLDEKVIVSHTLSTGAGVTVTSGYQTGLQCSGLICLREL